MALHDPFISNGQCFYNDNVPSADFYIPCGNIDVGDFPCCQNGDVCLEHSACFNAKTQNTYVAGCTNPNYDNRSVCPDKTVPFYEQQWVGLVRCWLHNETDTTQEVWAPCKEDHQPDVDAGNQSCTCDPNSPYGAVITGGTQLLATATLPPQRGLHFDYVAGKTPQVVLSYISRFGTYKTPSLTGTSSTITFSRSTTGSSSSSQSDPTTSLLSTKSSSISSVTPSRGFATCEPGTTFDCAASPAPAAAVTPETIAGISVGSIFGGMATMAMFVYFIIIWKQKRRAEGGSPGLVPNHRVDIPSCHAYQREATLPLTSEMHSSQNLAQQNDYSGAELAASSPVPLSIVKSDADIPVLNVVTHRPEEGGRQSMVSANTNLSGTIPSPSVLSSLSSQPALQQYFNNVSTQSESVGCHELPVVPENEQVSERNQGQRQEFSNGAEAEAYQSTGRIDLAMCGVSGSGQWQYQAYHPNIQGLGVVNDGYATGYERREDNNEGDK